MYLYVRLLYKQKMSSSYNIVVIMPLAMVTFVIQVMKRAVGELQPEIAEATKEVEGFSSGEEITVAVLTVRGSMVFIINHVYKWF